MNVQPRNNHESGIEIYEIWVVQVVLFLSSDLCISWIRFDKKILEKV